MPFKNFFVYPSCNSSSFLGLSLCKKLHFRSQNRLDASDGTGKIFIIGLLPYDDIRSKAFLDIFSGGIWRHTIKFNCDLTNGWDTGMD